VKRVRDDLQSRQLIAMAVALLLLTIWTGEAQSQEGVDPRTEPIPELDLDDPARSIVLDVTFNGPDDVQVDSIEIVRQRAPDPGGNPPLLRIQLLDTDGAVLRQFNEWNPLLTRIYDEQGAHSVEIADTASMTIAFLFNANFSRLRILDLERGGLQLVEVDLDAALRTVAVPYEAADWRFQQVEHGELEGFQAGPESPGFTTGQAAFGSGGSCPLQATVRTDWAVDTDMLLRRSIDLPAETSSVRASIRIDNDFVAFWNGVEIGRGVHEDCPDPERDEFILNVDDGLLDTGANLLAIRAIDRGVESFVDVQITAIPP
jgi:hypothetical protein